MPGLSEISAYHKLTDFPDDGQRCELIDGEIFLTAAPDIRHQKLVGELFGLIWLYLRQRHSGKAFFAPTEVELDDQTIVQPDICVVLKHSQAEITEKRIVGAPDWIIEVLSPSTHDYDLDIKRNLYVRHGVVYWAINSADETILTWDEYGCQIFKGNYPVNPSVLPAFCLSVASLLTASR